MKRKLLWTLAAVTTVLCLLVNSALAVFPLVVVACTLGKTHQFTWFMLAAIALSTALPTGIDLLFILGMYAFMTILDAIHELRKRVEGGGKGENLTGKC